MHYTLLHGILVEYAFKVVAPCEKELALPRLLVGIVVPESFVDRTRNLKGPTGIGVPCGGSRCTCWVAFFAEGQKLPIALTFDVICDVYPIAIVLLNQNWASMEFSINELPIKLEFEIISELA